LARSAITAIEAFSQEVRKGDFPAAEHTYTMDEEELKKFKEMIRNE
jgi:ketopantoate hydroxymethyltransferase